jgi:hypothetical protein
VCRPRPKRNGDVAHCVRVFVRERKRDSDPDYAKGRGKKTDESIITGDKEKLETMQVGIERRFEKFVEVVLVLNSTAKARHGHLPLLLPLPPRPLKTAHAQQNTYHVLAGLRECTDARDGAPDFVQIDT